VELKAHTPEERKVEENYDKHHKIVDGKLEVPIYWNKEKKTFLEQDNNYQIAMKRFYGNEKTLAKTEKFSAKTEIFFVIFSEF
jgi:GH18 family chitinase